MRDFKKLIVRLILTFFIAIFILSMLWILLIIYLFTPTKPVPKEDKQNIEYVVHTTFEENLGLKVKKIDIPDFISHITDDYFVKVELGEGADEVLTDDFEKGTYIYHAHGDDETSDLLRDIVFYSILDVNEHPMLSTLYYEKESILKEGHPNRYLGELSYTGDDLGFYRELVRIKKAMKYNPKTEQYQANEVEIKELRKSMAALVEKYGADLTLYLKVDGNILETATMADYIDTSQLPVNVDVVVLGQNGSLNSSGFQAK